MILYTKPNDAISNKIYLVQQADASITVSQFYCELVRTELFIDPNNTIDNKKYTAWRPDASVTITVNFTA
jgi:hypothetical protein